MLLGERRCGLDQFDVGGDDAGWELDSAVAFFLQVGSSPWPGTVRSIHCTRRTAEFSLAQLALPEAGAPASCAERIGAYIGWFRFADA
jgi:hypothetical protein